MDFDFTSFAIGLTVSGLFAWLITWSEKCCLASRVAHYCCEQAYKIIQCKIELEIKEKNIDIDGLGVKSQIDNHIFPIETEEFTINLLPSKRIQSDVHISESVGVYAKKHDLYLLIENMYGLEEGLGNFNIYYFCEPDFSNPERVQTPYNFNVKKYLIRHKGNT